MKFNIIVWILISFVSILIGIELIINLMRLLCKNSIRYKERERKFSIRRSVGVRSVQFARVPCHWRVRVAKEVNASAGSRPFAYTRSTRSMAAFPLRIQRFPRFPASPRLENQTNPSIYIRIQNILRHSAR